MNKNENIHFERYKILLKEIEQHTVFLENVHVFNYTMNYLLCKLTKVFSEFYKRYCLKMKPTDSAA